MATPIASIMATDVVSSFDLHKPEKNKILFDAHGDQGQSHFLMLKNMMLEKPVANETYGHYENNRYHAAFRVRAAVTDPGAGNDLVVTIHADDLDDNNKFYPRKNDAVMLKNKVTGYIHAVDTTTPAAPKLTLRLNDTAKNFGAVALGDTIIIISGVASEESGQPVAAFSGATYSDNDLQIIKETIGYSGVEMTNQTWVQINGMEGAPWYFMGQKQIDYRMMLKFDGALTYMERNTNTAAIDPDTGNRYRSTEGCYTYAARKAIPKTIASGAITVSDFDDIDLELEAQHQSNIVLSINGSKKYQDIENALVTYFADTNISYVTDTVNTKLYGAGHSKEAVVNFKSLTKSGRTFLFRRNPNSTNPVTYGADGFTMKDESLFLSLNKFYHEKNGESLSQIGMRYKALGSYNRRTEVWNVGGAGTGLKVTEYDKVNTFQRAHIGAHNACGESWVYVTPA